MQSRAAVRPAVPAALALLLLVPTAPAAPPVAQPWSVDLGGAGLAAGNALGMAFDEAGSQVLVATADRASGGNDNDLVHVRFDQGNATAEADANPDIGSAEGKATVSISADGKYAVAGGNYTGQGLLGENGANVFFYSLPGMTSTWRKTRPEPVTSTALSGDGTVVVVGTRNATGQSNGRILRYDRAGNSVWDRSAGGCGGDSGSGGQVLALDLSRDGKWLVVGSVYTATAGPAGCVQLFDTANINPVVAYKVPSVNAGDATAVDITANGQFFAAGTASGGLYVFQNTPAARNNPVQAQLPALAPVRAIEVSEDGAGVVAADAGSVNRYARGLELTQEWSASAANVRSLDATPDGEYVVVGAAQVLAFHRSSNATLWSVDQGDALVKVAHPGANDIRVAAASGTTVRGYRLHWALEARKAEPDSPPLQVALGQVRPYTVEVFNAGSAVDNFLLSASATGFTVDVNPSNLLLRPGQVGNTTVTFTPNPNAEARPYTIQVRAQGERSGVEQAITINATVGAQPRLGLGLADAGFQDKAVFQGEEHSVVLEVRNSGNARLEVAYDLTQEPNVGPAWEASLSRTSGVVEAGGVTTNTLAVLVPFDARNGTENFFNVTVRGEGAAATTQFRLVVNPSYTAGIDVVPQSKVVAPGKSVAYSVVVANNGTLRETYRLVYCVALPDLIPCVGNATTGLGGWSVALDTTPFVLEHDQSKSFQLAVGAPRGAIPNVDKLALQVEVYSSNPEHVFRDTRVVITSVQEEAPPPTRPAITPGFEALAVAAALGGALVLRRRAMR